MKIFKATALIVLILLTTKLFHRSTYVYDVLGYGHARVIFLGFVALLGLFFFLLGRLSKKTLVVEEAKEFTLSDEELQSRAEYFAQVNVTNMDDLDLKGILATAYESGMRDFLEDINYKP